MTLDPTHLLDIVIRPALEHLGHAGKTAEALVLGTAIQESRLTWLRQLGGGPALGLWQMEPATHDDIYANFLPFRAVLRLKVYDLVAHGGLAVKPVADRHEQLAWNLRYGAAMCRIHYLRAPGALPAADDIEGQAQYWKQHYNTPLGAGTAEEYVAAWRAVMRL